jgi:hypothetical protein
VLGSEISGMIPMSRLDSKIYLAGKGSCLNVLELYGPLYYASHFQPTPRVLKCLGHLRINASQLYPTAQFFTISQNTFR